MDYDSVEFIEEYTKELMENPAVVELFKDYYVDTLKYVVNEYVQRIDRANQYGDIAEKMEKEKTTKFIDEANLLLKAILIIKIFHKECEWRAGLFDYPGISIPTDFAVFTGDPFNCDFITSISDEEVELMQKFIASNDFDYNETSGLGWLYYDELKRSLVYEDAQADPYPEWFSFYDIHMGTSRFINLPNPRGEMIEKYRSVFFNDYREKREGTQEYIERHKNLGQRRHLSYKEKPEIFKKMDEILQLKEKKIKLKYYDLWSGHYAINDEAMTAIDYLSNFSELIIPIKEADTWQEGVINALDAFNRKSMSDALPEAYNNYKTQLELNIKSMVENQADLDFRKGQAELMKSQVLLGRKLLGEPENFDFLDLE